MGRMGSAGYRVLGRGRGREVEVSGEVEVPRWLPRLLSVCLLAAPVRLLLRVLAG